MSKLKVTNARRQTRVRLQVRRAANGRLRLSVFRSSKHIYAQVIDDVKGVTLAAASSMEKDLRGKTGAQDYKNYILSLMFYKRLCDQWNNEAEDAIAAQERVHGRQFSEAEKAVFRARGEHRFNIPQGSQWGDVLAAGSNLGKFLTEAMKAVAAANEGFPSPFLPGTVGVLALFAEHKLHYAYIGDSNGILISNGTLSYFTTPQTAEVHRRRKEFTSDEIRAVICNNPSHPCGYGVWNGMPSAAEFLRVGELPLSAGDRVLLCTDGIDPFLASLSDAA